jgi:hypothetical protein
LPLKSPSAKSLRGSNGAAASRRSLRLSPVKPRRGARSCHTSPNLLLRTGSSAPFW